MIMVDQEPVFTLVIRGMKWDEQSARALHDLDELYPTLERFIKAFAGGYIHILTTRGIAVIGFQGTEPEYQAPDTFPDNDGDTERLFGMIQLGSYASLVPGNQINRAAADQESVFSISASHTLYDFFLRVITSLAYDQDLNGYIIKILANT